MPSLARRRHKFDVESYLDKALSVGGLVGAWLQDEKSGAISYDRSGNDYHGAYTGVTLGQPGVPGMDMTSPLYDGANDYNNIHSAGFANDSTLLNGGFETAGGGGADIWANYTETAGDGALANEVVIIHQGVDSAKMTSGLTSNTNVFGDAMVSVPGTLMRERFWTYGDGVNAGRYAIYDVTNGAYIIPVTSTGITAAAWGMVAPQYTVPAGCISVRVEYWCPPVNGGVCYFDAGEIRRMNGFLGDQGSIIIPVQVANAGVLTDGATRHFAVFQADGGNYIRLRRTAIDNEFEWRYVAGGITLTRLRLVTSTDWLLMGLTWDVVADEAIAYYNGIQEGIIMAGLGTFVGNLLNVITVIGAGSTVPANVWHGNAGPALVFNEAKPPAEMAYLSTP